MSNDARKTLAGGGCMVLFSLPFAAVGLGCLGYLGYIFYQYAQIQGWEETPATIERAEVVESYDSDGGSTYRLEAEFSYERDGRLYRSDWVSLFGGSDNLGDWHHDRYAELSPYLGTGREYRCYVDPANPERAILFRELRLGMILFLMLFACIFGSVGFGLMIATLSGIRKISREAKLKQAHPAEPWTWKTEWSGGLIESNAGRAAYFMLAFGTIWFLISAPAGVIVPGEAIRTGEYVMLVALIFPVIGILLLTYAAVLIARHRKYGVSLLEIAGHKGSIGGNLRGMVFVPRAIDAPEGVKAALRCIERITTGSGKSRSTKSNTLWEGENVVQALSSGPGLQAGGVAIPVSFAIPSGLPEPMSEGNRSVSWELTLDAETPGLNYHATFEVPVFRGTAGEESAATAMPAEAPRPNAVPLNPRVVRVEIFEDGRVFLYPRSRHLFAGIFMVVFAAFFAAFIPAMIWGEAGYLFVGIWTLVTSVLGLCGLSFLLNEIEVDVSKAGIKVRSDYLVFARRYEVAPGEVAEITHRSTMQAGNDAYYSIFVKTSAGKEICAGSGIPSSNQAEQIIALMTEAM